MLNNVLLIDDDDITHFICKNVIEEEHITDHLTMLHNGKEGIEYFRHLLESDPKDAPELILLDLNMPVMDGWEFLKTFSQELENKFPKTKIIILTSSLDPLDFSQSKTFHNVIGFLNKPLIKERVEEIRSNEQLAPYF